MSATSLFMATVQVPVPEQPPPLQPENVEPESAAAVNVTVSPALKEAEQVEPQSMPEGELVTVPDPVPAFVTVRLNPG